MKDIKPYFSYFRISFQNNPQKKKLKGHTKKKCRKMHTIHPSIMPWFPPPETSCVFLLPQRSLASIPPSFAFSPFEGCGNAGNHNAPGFLRLSLMILWPKNSRQKKNPNEFYPHSPPKKQLEKPESFIFF